MRSLFPRHSSIELIPNGVDVPDFDVGSKNLEKKSILFMGRLHKKKCVAELVDAFLASPAAQAEFRLVIAGPDQGELARIKSTLQRSDCNRVELLGPVYSEQKLRLLEQASFFALPSHSEGFPTSIVEAMSYGCVPILSTGCNFPEAEALDVGITVRPKTESIIVGLATAAAMGDETLRTKQRKAAELIRDEYSTAAIAALQYQALRRQLEASAPKVRR